MPEPLTPDLAGKSVLITGASTGIGAAAARAFARAGCRVAIHYNASLNRAEEVAADVRFAGAEAFLVGGDLRTTAKARVGGGPGAAMYASAKGFISTFTHGLAREVVKDNIRVNAVSPGVIVTPFHERYSTPAMLESFKAQIPMGRLGTAEECAGAFLFLASEALSGFITGQIIEVNGGQLMP